MLRWPLTASTSTAHGSTGHAHHHAHPIAWTVARRGGSRGDDASRMVQIERDILAKNNGYAAKNRRRFDDQGIFALNLVSSPGSGKTTLLCRTIERCKANCRNCRSP
jgi:hydrogenase nickel incorporation protein HypB